LARFPEHWLRISPLSALLIPVAWAFAAAVSARRALYRAGVLESRRVRVPVIVVGNLIVGGAGKTPLVLALAARLRESGYRPGIVSRGYRGTRTEPGVVGVDDDPRAAGDEAVLLAQRSGCPVWTARDRAEAALRLLETTPGCDVIISDDGLQHYRLARDVEIAVEDERGLGNRLMLPAGPLREPATRRTDAVVINGRMHAGQREDKERKQERSQGAFHMALEPDGFYPIGETADGAVAIASEDLAGRRLHAVAGIGNPDRFFHLLSKMGLRFTPHAFPDHHRFTAQDLDFPECDAVLMTEKDAVKCARFAGREPDAPPLYALRVRARLDPAFYDFILTRLRRAHDGRATP
jgi:tetraacyldisaccharide 4'-kinase